MASVFTVIAIVVTLGLMTAIEMFSQHAVEKRLASLQNLCAALYQFAGEVGAPARVLDVLAAAQQGEPVSPEMIDAVAAVAADECEAI